MKDLTGRELEVNDLVAFAKKGRQVGEVAVGCITRFADDHYGIHYAVITDERTQQENWRRWSNEMLWLARA